MGIADKAQQFAEGHESQTDQAIDKAGDAADARTGGEHASGVDTAQQKADDAVGGDQKA
ncbi:antitoxin [Kineococcus sp. TRM81007]|uniref:antitoxin n=1 Tax=Kineococcus sp. TRM81007 TaxID=2925831 RepID=UPI001F55EB7D|nr:antitoxin [Kineococcus sp. TRM81007]MCI2240350.1 antitoxin [Kineococcus sp. TRM81007]